MAPGSELFIPSWHADTAFRPLRFLSRPSRVALPAADGHCASGITTRLYLGQDTPAGAVTDAQWERFVEDSVTPRFPEGFTVLQGQGRWRSAAGILHQEDTRVIEIVHDNSATSHARAREVGAAYKRRFVQQAVLVARAPTIQCLYASGD